MHSWKHCIIVSFTSQSVNHVRIQLICLCLQYQNQDSVFNLMFNFPSHLYYLIGTKDMLDVMRQNRGKWNPNRCWEFDHQATTSPPTRRRRREKMALLDSDLQRLHFDLSTTHDLPIAAVSIHVAVTSYTKHVMHWEHLPTILTEKSWLKMGRNATREFPYKVYEYFTWNKLDYQAPEVAVPV